MPPPVHTCDHNNADLEKEEMCFGQHRWENVRVYVCHSRLPFPFPPQAWYRRKNTGWITRQPLFLVFYTLFCHVVRRRLTLFLSDLWLTGLSSLLKQPSIELTHVGLGCIFMNTRDLCFSLFSKWKTNGQPKKGFHFFHKYLLRMFTYEWRRK